MNWMSVFGKTENITPEETRTLIASHPPGSFQLLDVRQVKEYEQAHIPGALLIPLGDLPERLQELNPDKETIVYCRSGVRSRSGAQILISAGFSRVLNMTGGITGWHGQQALGSETLGLEYFTPGNFSSAVTMAYAMEQGLRQFYQFLADRTKSAQNRELLLYMAKLEDGHMAKLRGQHSGLPEDSTVSSGVAEGGFDIARFIASHGNQLRDMETIIQTGMMFEAQAYDMYSRLARKEEHAELREFYLQMAAEEQRHLATLSRELDQRLS